MTGEGAGFRRIPLRRPLIRRCAPPSPVGEGREGEIKTPFNKQKLIESLSIFLHKPEIQNRIISLLSKEDLQIITAITCLENPTQQCLIKFFDGIFSFPVCTINY